MHNTRVECVSHRGHDVNCSSLRPIARTWCLSVRLGYLMVLFQLRMDNIWFCKLLLLFKIWIRRRVSAYLADQAYTGHSPTSRQGSRVLATRTWTLPCPARRGGCAGNQRCAGAQRTLLPPPSSDHASEPLAFRRPCGHPGSDAAHPHAATTRTRQRTRTPHAAATRTRQRIRTSHAAATAPGPAGGPVVRAGSRRARARLTQEAARRPGRTRTRRCGRAPARTWQRPSLGPKDRPAPRCAPRPARPCPGLTRGPGPAAAWPSATAAAAAAASDWLAGSIGHGLGPGVSDSDAPRGGAPPPPPPP